jgi:4-amino-4-deoxy-L-arabinose transferase-like glycosyltransferase
MSEVVTASTGLAQATPAAPRRVAAMLTVLAVVGAAWALLQLYGLSLTPFHTKGEPREAIVVQDLVRHGNWILPRRNGGQLPRKPPLFYWLAGVAAQRGGVDEASVRLPSAVMSGAACLLVAAVATVLYGGVAGLVSGLTLLTSFEWLRAATAARVDMTLTFGLTLVFIGLLLFRRAEHRVWLVLFYAGAAWATLSKGIPGLAIPAFQVLLLCLVLDRSLAFAWRLRPILGLLAVLLVAGAWYGAAALQGGRAFVSIVVNENFVRAVGDSHFSLGHRHSVGYLVGALLTGLLPWTILLPSVGVALWREWRAPDGLDRWDARACSLLWIVAVFTPYAIATSKRGVYLLPLYPAVCLLIGWWAAQVAHGVAAPRWLPRILAPLAWLLAGVLAVLALIAAAQYAGLPLLTAAAALFDPRTARDLTAIAAADGAELATALAVAAAAAVALAVAAGGRRCLVALLAMLLCAGAVIVAARAVILPAIGRAETRRPFAAALRRVLADPAALHTTTSLDYGTIFYLNESLPEYDRSAGGPVPRYLLLPEPAWLHMPPEERRRFERLPGLAIEWGTNQGYVAVLQRSDEAEPDSRIEK